MPSKVAQCWQRYRYLERQQNLWWRMLKCVWVCGRAVVGEGPSRAGRRTRSVPAVASARYWSCSVPPFCCRYFCGWTVCHFAVAISVADRSAILLSLFLWLIGPAFCCRYFLGWSVCHFIVSISAAVRSHHFAVAISVAVRSFILLSLFPWLIGLPFCCRYFRGWSVCHFAVSISVAVRSHHFAVAISAAVRSAILLSLFPWLFGPPFSCRYFRGWSVCHFGVSISAAVRSHHFAVATSVAVRSAILLSLFPWLFGPPFCCRYFRGCSVRHFAVAISVADRSSIQPLSLCPRPQLQHFTSENWKLNSVTAE